MNKATLTEIINLSRTLSSAEQLELINTLWRELDQNKVCQELALNLYQQEEVTLSRAAEFAGLTLWEFKDFLRQRGVSVVVQVPLPEEMDAAIAAHFQRLDGS